MDVDPDGGRDRQSHDVSLLSGQAALLDREGGRVACGVHAVCAI
jgi:hypothetical protein